MPDEAPHRKHASGHRGWPVLKEPARRPGFGSYAVLILLPLFAFLFMFGNPVLWSDFDQVERGYRTEEKGWQALLSIDAWRAHDPVTAAGYALERYLPFPQPVVHRAINLLLHLAATLAFFQLLHVLRAPGKLVAALAFGLHPAAVQPVFWAGYRSDLLALLLIFGTLILALRDRGARDYALALGLAAAASLLHPAALAIPVIFALGILYQERHPRLAHFNRVLPFVCIALFAGVWTGGAEAGGAAPLPGDVSRVGLVGENMHFFLGQSFLPVTLGLFHPYTMSGGYQVGANMSLLPFVLFIPFYALIFIRFHRFWSRSLLLALTSFFLLATLASFKAGRFLDGSLAHETHALYFALPFGIALVLCHLAGFFQYAARPLRPLWLGGLGILFLVEFLLTASFAHSVGDPVRMWQSIEAQWPRSWIPKAALIDYAEARQPGLYTEDERIKRLNLILEQRPDLHAKRKLLARTYVEAGQHSNAVREYKRLLRETEPSDEFLEEAATLFDNLGMTWDAEYTRGRKSATP